MFLASLIFAHLIAGHHINRPIFETVSVNVSTPTNNAPLDETLAFYKLNGTNGKHRQLTHSFIPVSCGAVMSVHHTDPHVFPDAGSKETPILLLNHGYPESSYIWRKITPSICSRVPCIVPDVSCRYHHSLIPVVYVCS